MQDAKIKRILTGSLVLMIICVVCIIVAVRYADKYRGKVVENTLLERKLDNLEQDIKKLDLKIRELEAMRYDLSLEKEKLSRDYGTLKERYTAFGKTIKALQGDVDNLQKVLKIAGENEADPVAEDINGSEEGQRLRVPRSGNNELLRELAAKTREAMILKIALESQAKRLGISEKYDPDLKKILKNLLTSLQ